MSNKKINGFSDTKRNNCRVVFETLKKNNGLTLLDLEWSTNLSRPTVVNMVRALEEANLIMDTGKRDSSGGRAPVLYGINPDAYYAIGVDFEYPVSRIVICDFAGEIKYSSRRENDADLTCEEAIEQLIIQIKEIIHESGIETNKFLGIGLGMPGSINLKKGMSVRFERVPGWENVDICGIITKAIGVPVYMENDVHLLYRAERELWKKKDNQDILFVAIRSGIGMAVFQRGHIIEGEFGNAGYIGHMVVQMDGLQCQCGNRGCLELYASDKAIIRNYELLTGEKVGCVEDVSTKAKGGKKEAIDVLEEAGRYLGVGIGNAISLFDINNIIVSSSFDDDILLESAQKELEQRVNIPQKRKATIYPSKLTEEKFASGGCKLVFKRTYQNIIGRVQL